MNVIAVATYNMSFMSALGFGEKARDFSSEAVFLAQEDNTNNRQYWKNALNLLIKFITDNESGDKKTCVIGLQEIIGPKASTYYLKNNGNKINNSIGSYAGIDKNGNYVDNDPEKNSGVELSGIGSAEIDIKLKDVNNKNGTNYIQVVEEVYANANTGWVGLSIIYDTAKFGEVKLKKIYDAKIYDAEKDKEKDEKKDAAEQEYAEINAEKIYDDDSKELKDNKGKYFLQDGRPLLIVVTQKNYVFVCAHGAQNPTLISKTMSEEEIKIIKNYDTFNDNSQKHKTYIQDRISDFLRIKKINPFDLYLMADLNDRFDVIKNFDVIINTKIEEEIEEIEEKKIEITYSGKAPKSCCHNWDACCPEDRFGKKGIPSCKFPDLSDDGKFELKNNDSIVYKDDDKDIKPKAPMTELGEGAGLIENYRYMCDKVFGIHPSGNIQIFGKTEGISKESDHQMVYALFHDMRWCIDKDGERKCGNVRVSNLVKAYEKTAKGGSRKKNRRRGTKKFKKLRKHKTKRFSKKSKYGRKTIKRTN